MNNTFEQYKCPNCAGTIKYNSEKEKFVCEYCGSEYDIDSFQTKTSTQKSENLKLFVCHSCGAETIANDTTTSVVCPFCDNAIVNSSKLQEEFKPEGILPFELSEEAAFESYKKHVASIALAPDTFIKNARVSEVRKLYVPYFLFSIHMEGKGVMQETWQTNTENRSETCNFKNIFDYENVPHEGSKTLDDVLMKGIEPFDFSKLKKFESAYLSGYTSDRYDDDIKKIKQSVYKKIADTAPFACNEVFNKSIRRNSHSFSCYMDNKRDNDDRFRINENGDAFVLPPNKQMQQRVMPYQITEYHEVSPYKYVLCPVYILNLKYDGKVYRFIINGQTGATVGKLPIDAEKEKKLKKTSVVKPVFYGILTAVITMLFCFPAFFVKENQEKGTSMIIVFTLMALIFGGLIGLVSWLKRHAIYKSTVEQAAGKETAGFPPFHYIADKVYIDINDKGFQQYSSPDWASVNSSEYYEYVKRNEAISQNKVFVDWSNSSFVGKDKFEQKRHF